MIRSRRMTMRTWRALSKDQQAVWSLWFELRSALRELCEMPLRPESMLLFQESSITEEIFVLFRSPMPDVWLHVIFDTDLLSVRYLIDDDPCVSEVLATVRQGEARFETDDGLPVPVSDLSHRMMTALTRKRAA
jgi:hypothetical protein